MSDETSGLDELIKAMRDAPHWSNSEQRAAMIPRDLFDEYWKSIDLPLPPDANFRHYAPYYEAARRAFAEGIAKGRAEIVAALDGALPSEALGRNRIDYVRWMVRQLGMKPMDDQP